MRIENAIIKSVDLSMADHGCLTLSMTLEGAGWGCRFGNRVLGFGFLGADTFSGTPKGIEYIMRIMDTVGVERFNDLKGKYIRVASDSWGGKIEAIGNILEDKWFNEEDFFNEEEGKKE